MKEKRPKHLKGIRKGRENLPPEWLKALENAQIIMQEISKLLYVDNRAVPPKEVSIAMGLLEEIAGEAAPKGVGALKKAQSDVENDDNIPSSRQVVLLLGLAEMQRKLSE